MDLSRVTVGCFIGFSRNSSREWIGIKRSNQDHPNSYLQRFRKYRRDTYHYPGWNDSFDYYPISDFAFLSFEIDAKILDIYYAEVFVISDDRDSLTVFLSFQIQKDSVVSAEQLSKIVAFLKGAASLSLAYRSPSMSGSVTSADELLRLIATKIFINRTLDLGKDYASFSYPVIYVGRIGGALDVSDFDTNHRCIISAIMNGWYDDIDFIKPTYIDSSLVDMHPFTYGSTFLNSYCTLEVHPDSVSRIALRERISEDDHHVQEYMYLAAVVSRGIVSLSKIRAFENRIIVNLPDTNMYKGVFSFFHVIVSTIAYHVRLIELRRSYVSLKSEVLALRPLRKDYTRKILERVDDIFMVREEFRRIDDRIAQIETSRSSLFQSVVATSSALIAMSALLLSAWEIFGKLIGS